MKENKDPLDQDVQFLRGVGPAKAARLARMGILTVEDLLLHVPARYVDRRTLRKIKDVSSGEEGVFLAEVQTAGVRYRGRPDAVAVVADETGVAELIWKNSPYMAKRFKPGMTVLFWGKIYTTRGGVRCIFHPEHETFAGRADIEKSLVAGRILPVYPLTEGLTARQLRIAIHNALDTLGGAIPDLVPADIRRRRKLMSREKALRQIHFPETLEKAAAARDCLAYEELLLFFLRFLSETSVEKRRGVVVPEPGPLSARFLENLGFALTGAQERAAREIDEDMARGSPMHRLLQGDVGSGKTAVAAYAALRVAEHGFQAAVMSPTEILAEQTYSVFTSYLEPLGLRVVLLESSLSKKKREENLALLSSGTASVAVGTHALITEDVRFRRLALAIVDEQHRFGVAQRSLLVEKGKETGDFPHFLVMTATPIPRTLALTFYGNLDISVMDEKPPGRGEVRTKWVRFSKRKEVYDWLFGEARAGHQAYIVAPLVEKSEKLEVAAAEDLFQELSRRAPEGIGLGLVHGRVRTEKRREVMEEFRQGRVQMMVATTVIEVGVDVPSATRMVIEHAERFGLSQLHQLRGRVNRSPETSYCILITPSSLSEDARARMEVMTATSDGFRIAEEDLKLRGPGQLLGTKQHGVPEFRVANLLKDYRIVASARADAQGLLAGPEPLSDPNIAASIRRRSRAQEMWVG